MACDIHAHLEVKIDGKWHYYSPVGLKRSYKTFAKMAGVRNYTEYGITPISEPKGMPEDSTFMTRFHHRQWYGDAHSNSWLSMDELLELFTFFKEENLYPWHSSYGDDFIWNELGVWVMGNSISGFAKYPEDYNGIEDIRLMFWFDN